MSALGLAIGKEVIPSLVGRLTKGRGRVVEKIAQTALEITGLTDEKEVMDKLNSDPQIMLRLKELAVEQAANEFEAEMKQAEFELADRQSARQLKDDGMAKTLTWTALIFVTVAFVTVVIMSAMSTIYQVEVDGVWIALISAMAGNASARVDQVFNFFFGSSKGSKDKSDELTRLSR